MVVLEGRLSWFWVWFSTMNELQCSCCADGMDCQGGLYEMGVPIVLSGI